MSVLIAQFYFRYRYLYLKHSSTHEKRHVKKGRVYAFVNLALFLAFSVTQPFERRVA